MRGAPVDRKGDAVLCYATGRDLWMYEELVQEVSASGSYCALRMSMVV